MMLDERDARTGLRPHWLSVSLLAIVIAGLGTTVVLAFGTQKTELDGSQRAGTQLGADSLEGLPTGRDPAHEGHRRARGQAPWLSATESAERTTPAEASGSSVIREGDERASAVTSSSKSEAVQKIKLTQAQEEYAGKRRAPTVIKNSVGLEFVIVPAPSIEPEASGSKAKLVPVSYMAATEVIFEVYRRVLGAEHARVKALALERWKLGYSEDSLPITCTTKADCVLFCEALSATSVEKEAGRRYRLPTWQEWDRTACLVGPADKPYWADSKHGSREFENSYGRVDPVAGYRLDRFVDLAPVASLKRNPAGIYDMFGNAAEILGDPVPTSRRRAETWRYANSSHLNSLRPRLRIVLPSLAYSDSFSIGFRVWCEVRTPR